ILIRRLRWRPYDGASTTSTWTGGTYGGITIKMSSAAVDYTALTTTFAANHGKNMATVFSGSAKVTAGAGTGTGVPSNYYVDVTLTTPFLYDPTAGNDLLVDIASDGTKWTPATGTTYSLAVASGSTYKTARMYNLTSHTATTGSLQANVGAVMEVNYTPAKGLYAGFTASPTTGGQNLQVTFKDTSFSSDPAGIQSWAWDFDGDTKVDSTVQNPPAFTFKCGKYSPSLTVTDKVHKPSTHSKKDLIKAGLVAAAFSVTGAARGMAPFKVAFTDQSTGPVVVYQWDFDGDGKVDSTQKSPTFTYTKDGTYDVKLTVIGPCSQDSVTKKGLIIVGETCLSTLFADNNGGSVNWGNFFDVNVKNANGIKVTSMEINSQAAANSPAAIDVYITPNTYVGNDGNAQVWTKVSSGSGTSQGRSKPTPINVTDFLLPAGKWGMCVQYTIGGMAYTNGTATNNTYSNADLTLNLGLSRAGLFSGTTNNPRIWNGTICYVAKDKAASGAYGFACPGTTKTPRLSLSADPVLGTNVKLNVTNMVSTPAGKALMFIGVKRVQTDLAFIGMPNCALFNEALVTLGFVNINGTGSISGTIPSSSSFVGVQLFAQAANADKGANALGVAASQALAIRIGNK
ncbi:MAG: PKD domain-containing protein, partial [Planctomycetota bacterium]